MDLRRLPELFCGFQRARGRGPTLYPVACSPQAWAAGAPFLLSRPRSGSNSIPSGREIMLAQSRDCRTFIDEIVLRDLRVGDRSASILPSMPTGQTGVAIRLLAQ